MQGQEEKQTGTMACLKSVWGPVADLRITKVQSPFILLKSCALALMVLKKKKRKIAIDGSNKKDSMDW